jgi:hypothetical protein
MKLKLNERETMDIYTKRDDRLKAVMDKHGAFWAFSTKQFDEAKVEGVEYMPLNMGLVSPVKNAVQLIKDMVQATKATIEEDLAESGKKKIIHRELANHEAGYTGSIDATFEALAGYGITEAEVQAEFPEYMGSYAKYNY